MRNSAPLSLLLALALLLSACGGGGGGSVVVDPPLDPENPLGPWLGLNLDNAASVHAVPTADPRLEASVLGARPPSRVDLRHLLPPIDSQGAQGSCVGWSLAYYTKTAIEKKEEGWNVRSGHTNHFSPAFIYNQRPNSGSGMVRTNALDMLRDQGVCRWPLMPYDETKDRTPPSQAARAEARRYRSAGHRRFGNWQGLTSSAIDEMKAWLHDDGTPIGIGMDWYDSVGWFRGENDGVILDAKGGKKQGGHAITIVGYDDNVRGGSFLLANSHGLNWGSDGFGWIPFTQLRRVFRSAYGVRDLQNVGGGTPPPAIDNDVLQGAGPILAGETKDGNVGPMSSDPADWWRFSAAAGQMATIRLTNLAGDLDCKLTDALENLLSRSQRTGTTSEEIVYTFTKSGTYYVKVYPHGTSTRSGYRLSLTLSAGQTNDVPAGATVIRVDQNGTGSVGGSDPRDWWRVTLGGSKQVKVTLDGLSADLDLYIYRPTDLGGDEWLKSNKGGSGAEAITFKSKSSGGDYYLLVYPYRGAKSTYTLRVTSQDRPDLKAKSFNVTYRNFSDRVEVTVKELKVSNVGTVDSPEYYVSVGLSSSNVPGSSYRSGSLKWLDTNGLRAGYVSTWNNGTSTISKSGLSYGSYYIVFEADSLRQVGEPNGLNNYVYSSYAVISR